MSSHFKVTAWEGSPNIQIRAAASSIFLDGEDVKKLEEFFAPKIRKDEREKILKKVMELFCIQKDSEAWRWLETLRRE